MTIKKRPKTEELDRVAARQALMNKYQDQCTIENPHDDPIMTLAGMPLDYWIELDQWMRDNEPRERDILVHLGEAKFEAQQTKRDFAELKRRISNLADAYDS